MDYQQIINVLLSLVAFLGGWMLRAMWVSLRDLRDDDKDLARKVQEMQILVAGNYVKRDDLDRMWVALFHKLDKIETKLDQKVDK